MLIPIKRDPKLNIFMRDGASDDGREEAGHVGDGVGQAHQGAGVVWGDVRSIEL